MIQEQVKQAERRWLGPSIAFMETHFTAVFLPSHDLTHHLRVWEFARRILLELGEYNEFISYELIEGVLLSALFHDSGMVVTRASEHGRHSVEVYDRFLQEVTGTQPDVRVPKRNDQIRHAIYEHDNKESATYLPFTVDREPDLLTLLSIADNLDALGVTGIYRYAEIYLHRGIPLQSLGIKILQNVSMRFQQLTKATMILPYVTREYQEQYSIIVTFYDRFNQQLLSELEAGSVRNGHMGIIHHIHAMCVNGQTRPEDLHEVVDMENSGKFVQDYFQSLHHEITG